MNRLAVGACVTLMMSVTAGPSLAQGTSLQRAACTPDVFRFCSGDIPHVDRITACLKQRRASLSSGCQGVFNSLEQTRVATRSIEADPSASAWCAPADPSAAGQEIWSAWCRAGASAD